MSTISERLRDTADLDARSGEPLGKCMREAADTIDALVEALERAKTYVDCAVHDGGGIDHCDIEYRVDLETVDAALAKARKGG